MTQEQIDIVQRTWRAVLGVADTFAEIFYGKLFSLDPSLRALFTRTSMKEQGRNLTAMMSVAVGGLTNSEKIVLALRQLGRRHAAYGVQAGHYGTVRAALVWALEKCFGDAFTPDSRTAWLAAYEFFAATMQDAAKPSSVTAPAPGPSSAGAARVP